MENLIAIINQNLVAVIAVLMVLMCASLIVALSALVQISKLKKRYNSVMGEGEETKSLEEKFKEFNETSSEIKEKYDKISEAVMDLSKNMDKCIQKVGIIRYNPFDEAGGNLCFAVALLDSENNGVILNGIHSRSGCYTYAKPVEMGVSEYVLSQEEMQALNMALDGSYVCDDRKEIVKKIEERYESEILPKRSRKKSGLFHKKSSKVSAQ